MLDSQEDQIAFNYYPRAVPVHDNGARNRYKRMALGRLLYRIRVGACVLTAAHVRKEGLGNFGIEEYLVENDYSRVTE